MLFVFMSQPDFACNPYALWRYVKENTNFETAWIVRKNERYDALCERHIPCAIYNTLDGQRLIEKADYIITNSYTFLNINKKEHQVLVNLWHGSGIKAHDYFNHEMNEKHAKKLSNFFDKVDLMCVHSLDDRFKLSAQLHFDMRKSYVTGQPRQDCIKIASGYANLQRLFGNSILQYEKIILYVPSFRANMSSHSGKIYSENIFRLEDYDDNELRHFLEINHAALIYKLHPVEQTAFKGRKYDINDRCYELTDEMLFEAQLQYTEVLNAVDIMVSDYSSIVFDFLLLNRPIVYLIPDYEEYASERGFVFHNIDDYMPGEKAFDFSQMLRALKNAIDNPNQYEQARKFVLKNRFDFNDNKASQRCLETILNYQPRMKEAEEVCTYKRMPSVAQHLASFFPKNEVIVDSTKVYTEEEKEHILKAEKTIVYITSEIPDKYRRLTGQAADEIADLEFYEQICKLSNRKIYNVQGGVDYLKFSKSLQKEKKSAKGVIGFAGNIDSRIYFSMVHCICEVFHDFDIVFTGQIWGEYPIWLDGFDNLHYVEADYDELPSMIQSFDVAILPLFGRHMKTIPSELFQYMAVGKQVVTSNMVNIPKTEGIYIGESISDVIDLIKVALLHKDDICIKENLQNMAKKHDWKDVYQNKCINS